jgi:Tfp pilus assembly protein PilE
MKGITPTTVTVALVAILAWVALGQWDKLVGRDDVRFIEDAQAALALHASYAKQLAKVKTIQVIQTQRFREFVLVADTASTDSARATALRAAVGACSTALLACSERALLAEARVAELEPLLTRGLKIVDCRVMGLRFMPRCPSRTASFFVGAGLGAAGALLVQ